jgi:hypothetical protein
MGRGVRRCIRETVTEIAATRTPTQPDSSSSGHGTTAKGTEPGRGVQRSRRGQGGHAAGFRRRSRMPEAHPRGSSASPAPVLPGPWRRDREACQDREGDALHPVVRPHAVRELPRQQFDLTPRGGASSLIHLRLLRGPMGVERHRATVANPAPAAPACNPVAVRRRGRPARSVRLYRRHRRVLYHATGHPGACPGLRSPPGSRAPARGFFLGHPTSWTATKSSDCSRADGMGSASRDNQGPVRLDQPAVGLDLPPRDGVTPGEGREGQGPARDHCQGLPSTVSPDYSRIR